MRLLRVRPTLAFLLFCAAAASAQSFRGGIRGRVTDATGAPVPGATVTANQAQTGLLRNAVTDASGSYAFPELPLGDYDVTASLSGFSSQTVKSVTVDASSTRQVDLVLAAGRQESLEVVATSGLVDQTDNTQGGTIQGQQASELPV